MEQMDKETLWKLRQEIVLGSIYYHDYDNSFGFTANSVCDFFDGYLEELWDRAIEAYDEEVTFENDKEVTFENAMEFDTADNLEEWYESLEDFQFEKEVV